jgi:hypothetical protein
LVIGICFGLNIAGTSVWIIRHLSPVTPTHASSTIPITNGNMVDAIVLDLLILGVVFWIGRIRKWPVATFSFRISWKLTGAGLLLFFAFQLIQRCLGFLTRHVFHGKVDFHTASQLTIPFILLISIVNPIFEESIEVGYFFQAVQGCGMWLTVLSSAVFRGFLHLIMGVSGFVFMFAEGLLHGFFYWRWRQLWPLIVAHGLQMLYSLLGQVK